MPFSIAISSYRTPFARNYWLWVFLFFFFSVWISTFLGTTDKNNWWLENTLTFLFIIFLFATYRKY